MLKSKRYYHIFLSVFACIVLWQLSTKYVFNPRLVPPPLVVGKYFVDMVRTGEILVHIGASMRRILIGYFLGTAIGITLGLLMGRFFFIRRFLDPGIGFMRSLSPVAIIPLTIVWFGVGETSKYVILLYASLIVIIINTVHGVMAAPLIRIRAAQCLGASNFKTFVTIVIPSAWPYILIGMRVTLGLCFSSVVVAEMVAGIKGIGFLIMQAREILVIRQMFVGIICLGILGVIADHIFQFVISKSMGRYMLEKKH